MTFMHKEVLMFEDVYCYKCGEFIITVEDGNVHQHICMDCVLKDIGGPEEDHLCEDKEDIMSQPTHVPIGIRRTMEAHRSVIRVTFRSRTGKLRGISKSRIRK